MKKFLQILELLKENKLVVDSSNIDVEIKDITFDSREVKDGSLFFAKGVHFKDEYLQGAKDNGAVAYIGEKKFPVEGMEYIVVSNIRKAMLLVARFFFDNPDEKIKLIGVTGTKGKSTTVYMIKNVLDEYLISHGKKPCGIISSIKTFDGINEFESHLTTPEAIELYRIFNNSVEAGLEYLVVEISSQGLKYDRIGNANFEMVVLLNIGVDHIGSAEHPTIEDYVESKLKIFDLSDKILYYKLSDNLEQIEKALEGRNPLTYDLFNPSSDYNITDIVFHDGVNKFMVNGEEYKLNMFGDFNVENATVAIAIAKELGVDDQSIKKALSEFFIESRSSVFMSKDKELIAIVDYAHNKLSFDKNYEVFKKQFPEYKIYSVFGASGGKGLNRRKDLGEAASLVSDKIYLVPDDPNYDNPYEISEQIVSYFLKDVPYEIFESRELGIKKAVDGIDGKTLIFVAGKGNESYQLVRGDYKQIESDYVVTQKLIENYDEKSKQEVENE